MTRFSKEARDAAEASYMRGVNKRLNALAERYARTMRLSKTHFEEGQMVTRPASRVVQATQSPKGTTK